jgi:hypothetical protein
MVKEMVVLSMWRRLLAQHIQATTSLMANIFCNTYKAIAMFAIWYFELVLYLVAGLFVKIHICCSH